MKLKKSAIGTKTNTQNLGFITIKEKHLDILIREGRYEFIDGMIAPNKLVALEDKKVSELRELAKDLEGYTNKLTKQELLDLINALPKPE